MITVRRTVLAALAAGGVMMVVIVLRQAPLPLAQWLSDFRLWMAAAGPLAVIAFIAVYCVLTLFSGPAGLMSLSAGLVWGFAGLPVVVVAATAAATLALFVGRYLVRDRVRRYVQRDRRLVALVRAVSEGGWRIVALIRLSPILPFGVQNYLLALTDVRAVPYALATAVAILPSSALYVYLGRLGQTVGSPDGGDAGLARWLLLGFGVVATVLMVREVTRRARRALAEAVDAEQVAGFAPDGTIDPEATPADSAVAPLLDPAVDPATAQERGTSGR